MSEKPVFPTFEEALAQLQAIVHELEEGQLGLETSLARFEQGIGLLKNCYEVLEQAEQRIELVTGIDAMGNPVTGPCDVAATAGPAESTAARPGRRRSSGKPAAPPAENGPPPEAPSSQRLF